MEDALTIQPQTDLAALLAVNMRGLREAAALTVKQAARRAGMHWRYWVKIEKEEGLVRCYMLRRIAHALRVEPATLLDSPLKGYKPLPGSGMSGARPHAPGQHFKRRAPSTSLRMVRPLTPGPLATASTLAFHRYMLALAKRSRLQN